MSVIGSVISIGNYYAYLAIADTIRSVAIMAFGETRKMSSDNKTAKPTR